MIPPAAGGGGFGAVMPTPTIVLAGWRGFGTGGSGAAPCVAAGGGTGGLGTAVTAPGSTDASDFSLPGSLT